MGKHTGPRIKTGPRPDLTVRKSPHSHRDGKPADSKKSK
jgi:hypothetical protein